MKISILVLMPFLIVSMLQGQTRKDLLWEYQKYNTNDHHLGIALSGPINELSNEEIKTLLDSAWTKKQIIIFLQIFDYLENPICSEKKFSDADINKALTNFRWDNGLRYDLRLNKHTLSVLFDHYLLSTDKQYLPNLIKQKGLKYDQLDILLIAYKNDLLLQIWIKGKNSNSKFLPLTSFKITDSSVAIPGPKSEYGDRLAPEGYYTLEYYPSFRWSDFYLAFRVSYPNEADLIRRRYWGISNKSGGDINIHGNCISIGCIPIGNPDMEELFFLIRTNQKNGSNINVLLLPFDFKKIGLHDLKEDAYNGNRKLYAFWQSLEKIDKYFQNTRMIPNLSIDQTTGYYKLD